MHLSSNGRAWSSVPIITFHLLSPVADQYGSKQLQASCNLPQSSSTPLVQARVSFDATHVHKNIAKLTKPSTVKDYDARLQFT